MVVSLGGFAFLQFHPWAQHAKAEGDDASMKKHVDEEAPLVQTSFDETSIRGGDLPELTRREIIRHVWQMLACQLILAAFSFGVIPSVMSYVYKKFAVCIRSR